MEGSYTSASKTLGDVPAPSLKRLEHAFRDVMRHLEPVTE
jgi:hypothetical protein